MSDEAQISPDAEFTSTPATQSPTSGIDSERPNIETKPTSTSTGRQDTTPSLTVFDDEGELSFSGDVKRGYYRAFQEYIAKEYPDDDLPSIRGKLRNKIASKAESTQEEGVEMSDDASGSQWKGLTVRFLHEARRIKGWRTRKGKCFTTFCKDLEEVDEQSPLDLPSEAAVTGKAEDPTHQAISRKEILLGTILTKSVEDGVTDVDKLSSLSQKHLKPLIAESLKRSEF